MVPRFKVGVGAGALLQFDLNTGDVEQVGWCWGLGASFGGGVESPRV